jgi:NitT/TauT family transport system substrate-binding protein
MIGADTRIGWWNFVREKFGYSDDQIRPYTFSLAPFLADRNAIQQGYLGSEPFLVREQGGFTPVVLSLADAGFAGYASLIATSRDLTVKNPDLVARFIAATAEGWHSYLDGDPAPGNALIKQANPDMTDALLAYGRGALKSHGIVESGDALTHGIGAMTDARWQDFFESMVKAKLYPPTLDYHAAYTLHFTPASH